MQGGKEEEKAVVFSEVGWVATCKVKVAARLAFAFDVDQDLGIRIQYGLDLDSVLVWF